MAGESTKTGTDRTGTGRTGTDRELRGIVRRYWPLALLGLVAVLVSGAVYHWAFPAYSWNRDEPVYVWQARALRHGVLLPTDGGAPAFFWPWLSGHRPGFFFSQYTLGWPLVLAGSLLVTGTPALAVPFGALLAVLGTYAIACTTTRDHVVALVAAGFMVVSPLFLVQSGVYLGYLFTLGLGLLWLAALLSGCASGARWRLVAAGLLVGWIFMTRPFDAVLWAAAGVVGVLALHWRAWRRLGRAALWAGVGFAPLFLATLAYNRHVTGSFTQFPITAAEPLDKFGFGLRTMMPTFGLADYTPLVALKATVKNAITIPWFVTGSYLGIVLALAAWWRRRHDRNLVVLVALFLVFPLGYFVFWGNHVSSGMAHASGPIYYVPLFGALLVLMAVAVVDLARRRLAWGVGLGVLLVAVSVPFAVSRLDVNHTMSAKQVPWRDAAAAAPGHSLVFVEESGPYLLWLDPFSSNAAALDGRVLWSTDQGAADIDLIASRPDRKAYLQETSVPAALYDPSPDEATPRVTLVPLRVESAPAVVVRARVTNVSGARVVVVRLSTGDHREERTLTTQGERGAVYETEWTIVAPRGGDAATSGALTLTAPAADVNVTAGFGPTVAAAAHHQAVRGRVPTRNTGDTLRVLLPSRTGRLGRADGHTVWFETERTPQLEVTASPRAGDTP